LDATLVASERVAAATQKMHDSSAALSHVGVKVPGATCKVMFITRIDTPENIHLEPLVEVEKTRPRDSIRISLSRE
jgi:hypothetical protein